jgi:hypothetical protein
MPQTERDEALKRVVSAKEAIPSEHHEIEADTRALPRENP